MSHSDVTTAYIVQSILLQAQTRGTNAANPNRGQLAAKLEASKSTRGGAEPQQPERLVVSACLRHCLGYRHISNLFRHEIVGLILRYITVNTNTLCFEYSCRVCMLACITSNHVAATPNTYLIGGGSVLPLNVLGNCSWKNFTIHSSHLISDFHLHQCIGT